MAVDGTIVGSGELTLPAIAPGARGEVTVPRFVAPAPGPGQEAWLTIRFSTARIDEHMSAASRYVEAAGHAGPERLAGRLKARLQYADVANMELTGAGALLSTVLDECAAIHTAIYDTFVAYSLEMRLPA